MSPDAYVNSALEALGEGRKKARTLRTTHMVAMRHQVIAEFLKAIPSIKTCKNCKGYVYIKRVCLLRVL